MYKRILVTLDGSALAESVLPHAKALCKQFDAEMLLLNVVASPVTVAMGYYEHASADVLETLRTTAMAKANTYLQGKVAELQAQGLKVRGEVKEGEAVECILHYADEWGVDLIAMATHGRSGLGRWVYGSVADRVLRGAVKPVLLIRSQE